MNQEYLKSKLHYNSGTGIFTWLKNGKVAGSVSHGYIKIMIDYKNHYAHRLAILYMTGGMPSDQTDHLNHDRADNRFSNLVEATNKSNGLNQSMKSNNTSGVTGVSKRNSGSWTARIMSNGIYKSLGTFKSKKDAIEARLLEELECGFHVNHGMSYGREK